MAKENTLSEVSIANINAPGQIVISGTEEGVSQLSELALSNKAKRVIPIPVSVAAHSSLMIDQSKIFKDFVDKVIDVYNLSDDEIQEVKHD